MSTFVASLALLVAFVGISRAEAQDQRVPQPAELPKYDIQATPLSEIRSSLLGLAADSDRNQTYDADREQMVLKLVGSYRMRGLPGASSITNDSFLKLIVEEVLQKFPRPCSPADFAQRDRLRAQASRAPLSSNLQAQLADLERCSEDVERQRIENTSNVSYSTLFDRALAAYLAISDSDHSTEADLVRGFGKVIGKCLAKRIVAVGDAVNRALTDPTARQVKCDLDETPVLPATPTKFQKVGELLELGFAKFLSCPARLHIPSDCRLRQKIYNIAKPQLIHLKNDPRVLAFENSEFNRQVRQRFLDELNTRAASYNDDLVAKFGGVSSVLLTPAAPLIERDTSSSDAFSLKELADGLHADVAAASVLHHSNDQLSRGVAAALLYAAANRAVFIMGGLRAKIGPLGKSGSKGESSPLGFKVLDQFDPGHPGNIPVLETENFGGIGVGLTAGEPVFGPWDLSGYSVASGGALRVFPSLFELSAAEVPKIAALPGQSLAPAIAYETLEDLGDLLEGLTYFLKVTGRRGELSQYFVPEDEFASDLGNRQSPALFPREGRALVYGLAASVLQNLAAPSVGHLESASAGLKYHDVVSLAPTDPRYNASASTAGVSKILLAARNFRQLVNPRNPDPDFPSALLQYLPQVDNALVFGQIELGSQNPCTDGGFGAFVEGPCAGSTSGGGRALQDTVDALRAITAIYNDVEQDVVLIKLKQSWQFLDKFWTAGASLPTEVLGLAPQPVDPSHMWELLALWDATQQRVTQKLGTAQVPWPTWKSRFETLRQRLDSQLQTSNGPEPLVP